MADILELATKEIDQIVDSRDPIRQDFSSLYFRNENEVFDRLRVEREQLAGWAADLRQTNTATIVRVWMSFEDFSTSDLLWDSTNVPTEIILGRILPRDEFTEATKLVEKLLGQGDR
ncbi:MAG: hypothetical protein AAF745_07850 [Planctomycetota bacterium]